MLTRLRTRFESALAWLGVETDPFADDLRAEDNVTVVLRGPDGREKRRVTGHNLLTTAGKEKLVERLLAAPGTEGPKYIGIGKSSTAATVGDTALGEQSVRKSATTRSVSGAVLTLKKTFGAGEGTGEVKEAGVFAEESGGTMFSRIVFSVVNKGAEDSLEIVWTLTQS